MISFCVLFVCRQKEDGRLRGSRVVMPYSRQRKEGKFVEHAFTDLQLGADPAERRKITMVEQRKATPI